ncbi:hypothetical protein RJ639_028168 [Escallonia herrerae]|uniref:Dihydroflavonol 4-reductase n=1 Tax=Escallonia herrerae TaxID=1293975 RepID=A0AA88XBA9_9ASTE|nr:hypothetical protein RJ639_028168 [Escallonia herrerae]
MEESKVELTYCVTGATGYIGSWLVKSLLQRGCRVHATVRDPAKCLHLLSLAGGDVRLMLFKADLHQEGSFDEAVRGCDGVFHVAASMEFSVPEKENVDNYARSRIFDPAIEGTLNLLNACLNAKSVKRVVLTSSISTMTAKDDAGNWLPVVDESYQTPIDRVWNTKTNGWVYVLAKLLTEEAAFQFAKEKGIDLVSVITTTVAGPFLTPMVPLSVQVLLSPITGDSRLSQILSAVHSRMGSVALVHIEDICSAHIFLMENARAEGRYICCSQSCVMSELVHHLAMEYPCSNVERLFSISTFKVKLCRAVEMMICLSSRLLKQEHGSVPSEISSRKLRDLGFTYKYGVPDIIKHTISSTMHSGFFPCNEK